MKKSEWGPKNMDIHTLFYIKNKGRIFYGRKEKYN